MATRDALPTLPMTAPIGLKGPRGDIIMELKWAERLTARELASRLNLSLNAIRHHLRELAADGYVRHERVARGVGAPAHGYRLSPAGEALFPRRYEDALTHVLEQVVAREGRQVAVAMLQGQFEELAQRLRAELAGASPGERLRAVAAALSGLGYMAEAGVAGEEGSLVEHNCALRAIAERFPELCAAEQRFLAEVLEADVERAAHVLAGACACAYRLRFPGAVPGMVSPGPAGGRAGSELPKESV